MRLHLIHLVVTFSLLLTYSKADAQAVEHRDVKPFDKLVLSGSMIVELVSGDMEEIRIECSGISPERIFTRNKSDVLEVSLIKDGLNTNTYQVKVRITYKDVDELKLYDNVELLAKEALTTKSLKITAEASCNLSLPISINTLEIYAHNGSNLLLTGSVTNIKVKLENGSHLMAYGLVTRKAKIEANGGSKVQIVVADSIEADASTGSTIAFKGEPNEAIIKTTFGGQVLEE